MSNGGVIARIEGDKIFTKLQPSYLRPLLNLGWLDAHLTRYAGRARDIKNVPHRVLEEGGGGGGGRGGGGGNGTSLRGTVDEIENLRTKLVETTAVRVRYSHQTLGATCSVLPFYPSCYPFYLSQSMILRYFRSHQSKQKKHHKMFWLYPTIPEKSSCGHPPPPGDLFFCSPEPPLTQHSVHIDLSPFPSPLPPPLPPPHHHHNKQEFERLRGATATGESEKKALRDQLKALAEKNRCEKERMDELLEGVIHSQRGELEKRKAEFVDLQARKGSLSRTNNREEIGAGGGVCGWCSDLG